jgi:hypothetical protein
MRSAEFAHKPVEHERVHAFHVVQHALLHVEVQLALSQLFSTFKLLNSSLNYILESSQRNLAFPTHAITDNGESI